MTVSLMLKLQREKSSKRSFGTKSGMSEAVTRDSDALAETV